MADFKFKVAYTTDQQKIEPALAAGTIDEGDLVIVNEDGVGSMKFITNEKKVIGLDASLTDVQRQSIIDDTLEEADSRYVTLTNDTVIINGGSSLVPENAVSASSSDEFISAIADESVTEVALAADIVVNDTIAVTERSLTFDLAGHVLSNEEDIWAEHGPWSNISVENATLVLNDSADTGAITALANDCFAIDIQDNGTVYVNGGTYSGNIVAIYLYGENATLYITGGYFKIQQLNTNGVESPYGLMINVYNEVRDSAKVVITGGTFEGYNPAEPEEGEMTFLAEGYTTQYDATNNTYTVIKEG